MKTVSLHLAHFVFEDDEILVASADNCDDAIAGALQGGGAGIGHRRAHASTHNDDGAEVLDLGGLAERTDDIENGVAGFERVEKVGGFSDRLDDDVDRTFFGVGVSAIQTPENRR